jgi:hypothetical protein
MKKLPIFFFLLASLQWGCTKEKSRTEQLTAGPWRLESIEVSPAYDIDGDGDLDTNEPLDSCDLDDEMVFSADGSFFVDYRTLCLPGDPDTVTGIWAFDEAETSLSLTYGMLPVTYTFSVFALTEERLSLASNNGSYTSIRHYFRP